MRRSAVARLFELAFALSAIAALSPVVISAQPSGARKISIRNIGGWNSFDHVEVIDGRWTGQPNGINGGGNYLHYYAVDSTPGLSYWSFLGSGFGQRPGQITFSDPGIVGRVRNWTDTQITVEVTASFNYTYNRNVLVTITAADGARVSQAMQVIGTIETRGFGQCTWYVANVLLSRHLRLPMGAYQTTGPITADYIPQQWDVIDFHQTHTSIILTPPVRNIVPNADGSQKITYSFTIGEMNADWSERASTISSQFVVNVKNGARSIVQGITSGVSHGDPHKTATFYFAQRPITAAMETALPDPGVPPSLHLASAPSLRSGDSTEIIGENFTRNSRITLLQTAPGSAESFLVSFTSDPNGGFRYPFSAACDARAGAYLVRALDQAPATSGIRDRKSNFVTLTVSGKATNCLLDINKAQASGTPATAPSQSLPTPTPTFGKSAITSKPQPSPSTATVSQPLPTPTPVHSFGIGATTKPQPTPWPTPTPSRPILIPPPHPMPTPAPTPSRLTLTPPPHPTPTPAPAPRIVAPPPAPQKNPPPPPPPMKSPTPKK